MLRTIIIALVLAATTMAVAPGASAGCLPTDAVCSDSGSYGDEEACDEGGTGEHFSYSYIDASSGENWFYVASHENCGVYPSNDFSYKSYALFGAGNVAGQWVGFGYSETDVDSPDYQYYWCDAYVYAGDQGAYTPLPREVCQQMVSAHPGELLP